ncbi:MAG: metallophosphoesterase [Burkholderiaceae bacterium]
MNRRSFLKLSSAGAGAVFLSGLQGGALAAQQYGDFYFVQMSDSHWGYTGPANPESASTLKKAVAAVNELATPPEFIVFTGDLTHTTDDPMERRRRLGEFKEIVSHLRVPTVHFMPGEHDASLDFGAAYKEYFGDTHYTFDHKGVHFIVLDNVSDPGAALGDDQLAWLKKDLALQKPDMPVVVFTHRPLFDLAPEWDWATRDGKAALDILDAHQKVTVFYGHIHQENHFTTGRIHHHSAKSLIFPLPAPKSQEKRNPVPWDPAVPFKGLGFREVEVEPDESNFKLQEFPLQKA